MHKKILIADDHSVVRLGTKIILEQHLRDLTIDFATNYKEVTSIISVKKLDLLILDIEMEGSIYKSMIKEIKTLQPAIKILIFSSSNENVGVEYIEEGAEGFLNKLSSDEVLVKAVQLILEEGYYYPPAMIQHIRKPRQKDPFEMLSERELQIFKLLGEGNGILEISNLLNLRPGTVGTYKNRIYTKLGIKSLVEIFKIYNKLQ
ncbi:response regulator [Chryseobacterium sp. MMS23-Vi53]|uniref:response regulator n=1 Tax=Chryseobacterium sp. MMS23-Vi53 TaxID=3386644 RepID=UPI0039ED5761